MKHTEFSKYLKKHNKKHVIFDFDETLATLHIGWEHWHEDMVALLKRYEPTHDLGKYTSWADAENAFLEKFGDQLRTEMIAISYKNERDHFYGYTPHRIPLTILQTAAEYATVHVWTSNDKRTVLPVMNELGITQLFDIVIGRNDVSFIKPHADGFAKINKQNSPKEEFVMIGDSSADKRAAKSAGIDFLHVSSFS